MKLKGISTVEQHIEKYILTAAAVALGGVVVWQFIDTSKVKVGSESLAPSDIYEPLKKTAQQTRSRVEDPNPKLPEAPKVNLAEAFSGQLRAKVAPKPQLVALGIPVPLSKQDQIRPDGGVFAEVTAPAPFEIHAHPFWSTIDPLEPVSEPSIATVLPKEQPFDMAAVSVQIAFDGSAFREELDKDPDGPSGPVEPVRRAWYSSLDLIGLELEREELQPDGSFAKATIVEQMPGRFNGAAVYNEKVKAASDVPGALAEIHAVSTALRPPFYNTLTGTPAWVEPALATDSGEDQAGKDVKGLLDQRSVLQKNLETINKQLQGRGGQPRQADPRGGGGGGKSGGPGTPPPGAGTKKDPQVERLERAAANKQAELDKNKAALAALGVDIDGKPLPKANTGPAKAELALLDNKVFKAWAHDVHTEPGKTYRYRARVLYNNPFFAQAAYLKDEQKKLADNPIARGQWSAWTGDVAVDARENYFITSAGPADPLRGPHVTVDIYKFFYGYPRRVSVNLEPGDLIAGVARIPEGLVTFDLKKLEEQRAKPPEPAPNAPDTRDRGAGGKGGGLSAPPPTPDKPDAKKEELLGTPLPRELPIEVSAMVLDAAYAIGGLSGDRSLAYLRVGGDQIVTRSPEQEKLSPLFKRLLAQSRLGDQQGKVKVEPKAKEKKEEIPVQPPLPKNPGGGGGGGGGG